MSQESDHVATSRPRRKNEPRVFTPEEEEKLKAMYHYDPATGIFTWRTKPKRNRKKAGDTAGCRSREGRVVLSFGKTQLIGSRVAFFLMTGRWPAMFLDHVNGDKEDNRWCNLREATGFENMANKGVIKSNKSGFKGVCFDGTPNRLKKWRAGIMHHCHTYSLGHFHTPEDAYEAYCSAAFFLHGEFVNLG